MIVDVDVAVVGGGAAGLSAAFHARRRGATVALVERDRLGGDCTWTGCVPSKALLERAREVRAARRAGWDGAVDLATVMDSVRSAVLAVAADESPSVLASRGIRLVEGQARFTTPKRLEVDGTPARARVIVLATGAGPLIPEVDGLPDVEVLTTRHHLRSAVAACAARGRRRWRRAALRSAVGAALALAATAGLAGARLLAGPLPGGFVEARSGTRAPELPVAAPQLVR